MKKLIYIFYFIFNSSFLFSQWYDCSFPVTYTGIGPFNQNSITINSGSTIFSNYIDKDGQELFFSGWCAYSSPFIFHYKAEYYLHNSEGDIILTSFEENYYADIDQDYGDHLIHHTGSSSPNSLYIPFTVCNGIYELRIKFSNVSCSMAGCIDGTQYSVEGAIYDADPLTNPWQSGW